MTKRKIFDIIYIEKGECKNGKSYLFKFKNKTFWKTVEVSIGEKTIEIKQYLPISEKESLIDSVLQKSVVRGIYNPLEVEMYFNLNIIYLYTNISFSESQRNDERKLYDAFESNGYIDQIVQAIPDEEYNYLWKMTQESVENWFKYNLSAAGMFRDFIELLPANAQKAADIINGINTTDISNVISFAKAINNNQEF